MQSTLLGSFSINDETLSCADYISGPDIVTMAFNSLGHNYFENTFTFIKKSQELFNIHSIPIQLYARKTEENSMLFFYFLPFFQKMVCVAKIDNHVFKPAFNSEKISDYSELDASKAISLSLSATCIGMFELSNASELLKRIDSLLGDFISDKATASSPAVFLTASSREMLSKLISRKKVQGAKKVTPLKRKANEPSLEKSKAREKEHPEPEPSSLLHTDSEKQLPTPPKTAHPIREKQGKTGRKKSVLPSSSGGVARKPIPDEYDIYGKFTERPETEKVTLPDSLTELILKVENEINELELDLDLTKIRRSIIPEQGDDLKLNILSNLSTVLKSNERIYWPEILMDVYNLIQKAKKIQNIWDRVRFLSSNLQKIWQKDRGTGKYAYAKH